MNFDEFEGIKPYTDQETVEALDRIARNPAIPVISKYLFPSAPLWTLTSMIKSVDSVDSFQEAVMIKCLKAVLDKTSDGLTVSGLENLEALKDRKFLLFSNHRDIILDPAITQSTLNDNGIPMTEICVGSNLLSGGPLVEDLLRSNRMIKVIRGISARELYLSSQLLSKYIRESITTGHASIWIAQKEGRSKNGSDVTEQGLLKMFDLSGSGDFDKDFSELNIVPVSISYEIESCDTRKARELFIKERDGEYHKKDKEDLHSILTGIRQKKGRIHLNFCKPLGADAIARASVLKGNERYQSLMRELDRSICEAYRLWPNNYIAFDLMTGGRKYADRYSEEQRSAFIKYVDHRMSKLENSLDKSKVRDIFLHIYGNPVVRKEEFGLL